MKKYVLPLLTGTWFIGLTNCIKDQTDDIDASPINYENPLPKKSEHLSNNNQNSDSSAQLLYSQLNDLVKRLISPDGDFRWSDRSLIDQIKTPVARNSLEEAALALSILYISVDDRFNGGKAYPEQDLSQAPQAVPPMEEDQLDSQVNRQTTSSSSSVENLAREWQLDFLNALDHNPYLDNYQTIAIAIKSQEKNKNSPEFDNELRAIVQEKAQKWAALHKQLETGSIDLASESDTTQPSNQELDSEPLATSDSSEISTDSDPNSASQENLEEVFVQADELVSQGKYYDAIELLKKVDSSHLQYGTVQEKIKNTSNLAVHELRQKAAKSFQASLPVADKKARHAYLVDAKKYLEEAIEKYPQADQIQTVKQNLEVIQKNLATLDSSTN